MNNYEIANMIHNLAMEAADFANIARMKGNNTEALKQLQLAYTLDKDAALRLQTESDENEWKFIYLSSAGWLAYQLNIFEEAIPLVELGLASKAKGIALDRLLELKDALKEKVGSEYNAILKGQNGTQLLFGVLASADMEQEEVKIQEIGKTQYRKIYASKDLIQKSARYLIGESVQMNTKIDEKKGWVLQNIRRAA